MVYCIRHTGILQGIVMLVRPCTVTVITAGICSLIRAEAYDRGIGSRGVDRKVMHR
jgi:hypothetical protein